MAIRKFNSILQLLNDEILEGIVQSQKQLFTLRFKKATGQPFKSHEIKHTKCELAQLKTLLKLRLNSSEKNNKI